MQVMESWRVILKNVRPNAFKVTLEDVRVYANATSGFVTCVEVIDADDSVGRWVGGWGLGPGRLSANGFGSTAQALGTACPNQNTQQLHHASLRI